MKFSKKEVGKRYYLTYYDVEYNDDGWVNPKKYKPLACDIVTILVQNTKTERQRSLSGWWTGFIWEALHLTEDDKVLAWRLNEYSDVGLELKDFPVTPTKRTKLVIEKAEKWVDDTIKRWVNEAAKVMEKKEKEAKGKPGRKKKYRRLETNG